MEFTGWTAPGYQPPDERVKYRYGLATDSAAKTGRDDLHYLGIHPNLTIKWLAWSGGPTRPCFPIDYYFARR